MPFDAKPRTGACFYFGTFNPIHAGHLMIAQAALAQFGPQLGFDAVTFVPAGYPPHRADENDMLDARQRLKLVQLATAGNPRFRVSDFELRQTGPSYTSETIRTLIAEGVARPPVPVIIGSDALAGLAGWHNPAALAEMALFLQAPRPETPFIRSVMLNGQALALNTQAIEMPMLALSSTWVRHRLREFPDAPRNNGSEPASALRHFLPDPAWQYIRDNGLYRD